MGCTKSSTTATGSSAEWKAIAFACSPDEATTTPIGCRGSWTPLLRLPASSVTLDGEGCGLPIRRAWPDFERLRAAVGRPGSKRDAFLYAFDLLEIDGARLACSRMARGRTGDGFGARLNYYE